MSSLTTLKRRKFHIENRLKTAHLTESQRLELERELWSLEEQLKEQENGSTSSPIELRGQSLRI